MVTSLFLTIESFQKSPNMENKITTPITKGLIITLIGAVLDLVAGFAHIRYETWWRWIPAIITFGLIIWACVNFSNQMQHNVTFGNIFAHGFKTGAVVACLSLIYFLVSIYLIFPETKEISLQKARENMEARQNLTSDQIDQGMEFVKRSYMTLSVISIVLFTLVVGAVASLIGAAIAKKNPVTPFDKPLS
jgi:hypothetical protein